MSGKFVFAPNVRGSKHNNLAEAITRAIVQAVNEEGLRLDDAVCVTVSVAADFARAEIDDGYLDGLAQVVRDRRNYPKPTRMTRH